MSEWVNCKDKLPEPKKEVWVYCGWQRLAYHNGDQTYDDYGTWSCFEDERPNSVCTVTHWIEKPADPAE